MDTTTSIPPEDTTTPLPDPGDPTTSEPTTDIPADPTTTEPTTTEDTTTIPEDTTTTSETTTSEPTTTISDTETTTSETTTSQETTTPPPTTTSESTSSIVTTNPGGGTTTLETVVTVDGPSGPSNTPSATSDSANNDDRGFFGNTGAVAGVFSVVGVLVLILTVVLVTTCMRRRRRKQFDRDVDEAAREAAGVQPPIFLEDADDNNFRNQPAFTGYSDRSNAYTGYSDTTHGTFAQPPMMDQYNGESYGMHNVSTQQQPYDTGFAGVGAGAAAAGAGVAGLGTRRARSQRRPDDNGVAGFSSSGHHQGFGEDLSPYPAFVAPGAGNHNNAYTSDSRYPSNATDPYPAFIAPPPEAGSRRSQHAASGNFNDASTTAAASTQPSYAERYQPGYKGGDQLPPPSHAPAPVANNPRATSVYDDDAYGGYSSHGHGSANDHRDGYGNSPSPRDSDNDDDMPRVLQVANR